MNISKEREEWLRIKAQAAADERKMRREMSIALSQRKDAAAQDEAATMDLLIAARRGQRMKDSSR